MTRKDLEHFKASLQRAARDARAAFAGTGETRFREHAIRVTTRSCDGCAACCSVMHVDELKKPAHALCQHLTPGSDALSGGCGIYPAHPRSCAIFACQWRVGFLEDGDRPDAVGGLVVVLNEASPMVFSLRTPWGFSRWADLVRVARDLLAAVPREASLLLVTPVYAHGDPVLGALNLGQLEDLVALWEPVMAAVEAGRLSAAAVRLGIIAPYQQGLGPQMGLAGLQGSAAAARDAADRQLPGEK